jgi:hypothetical protein
VIQFKSLRSLFANRLEEARRNSRSFNDGRYAALREFHDMLGLNTDARGFPQVQLDERGLPLLKPGRIQAREFSLRGLAEAIMGHDFVEEYYHPNSGFNFTSIREAAIDPSAFININTFNLATAGLINAEIMERFNQPQFIGRNLVRVVPTKMNGQKLISVARMPSASKAAKGRLPGETHAEIGFGDAYQTTPQTVEQALKCSLTREAVFFDITGQVMDEAGAVGEELAYGQEKDIADEVLGVTNTYNRNGTSYNTYQTSSPYVNDQSNEFLDYNDLDQSRLLFVGMTDPETGKEILVEGTTLLVMPAKEVLVRQQMMAPTVQIGSQNTAANFPGVWTVGGNPISRIANYTIITMSAIWKNRATASDGLGLSSGDADKLWFNGDFQRAFYWMENWPLTPWMASADELVMKDRGLIAVFGCNYRGKMYTREPRYVVRNRA